MTGSEIFQKAAGNVQKPEPVRTDVRQVTALAGQSYSEALQGGLDLAARRGWKDGFLLDLNKARLVLDDRDCSLWAQAGASEAERRIVLETLLFKALGAQFPCGDAAPQGPYWLPVAAAADLRLFPFDSAAKSEFLRAVHETLTPSRVDGYLRQIEQDYFDHLIRTVLPGLAKSSETAAFAAGPVFALCERVFGSSVFCESFLDDERASALEVALAALNETLARTSAGAQEGSLLSDTVEQIGAMQYALAERRAMARGALWMPAASMAHRAQ